MDAAARRSSARLLAGAAAVVVAVALLVIVARRDPPPPPAPAPTPVPSWVPLAIEPPAALRSFAQLLDPVPRRIPVAQGGVPLRVDGLSSTGLLVGGAGFGADPYRAVDRIGVVEPGATTVRWLTEGPAAGIRRRAAGDGVVAWAETAPGGDMHAMCAHVADGWRAVRVSTVGIDHATEPVQVDGRTVAWMDKNGTAWASDDCGRPRTIGRGAVVALALPIGILRPFGEPAAIVPVTGSGATTPLPAGPDPGARFAASRDSVVWVAGDGLMRYDRETGRIRQLEARLPTATDSTEGSLTVGNRLVAYASRPLGGDPSLTRSVLYDLTTGAWILFNAEVFVAGDMIAWREAAHYAVTTTN